MTKYVIYYEDGLGHQTFTVHSDTKERAKEKFRKEFPHHTISEVTTWADRNAGGKPKKEGVLKVETEGNNQVTIIDVKIPFWSMVTLMVKLSIAVIPAVIILFVLGSVFSGFFIGLVNGLN